MKLLLLTALLLPFSAYAKPTKLFWDIKVSKKSEHPKTAAKVAVLLGSEVDKRKGFVKKLPKWAQTSPKKRSLQRKTQNRLARKGISAHRVTVEVLGIHEKVENSQLSVELNVKLLGFDRYTETFAFVSRGKANASIGISGTVRDVDRQYLRRLVAKHAVKAAIDDAIQQLALDKKKRKRNKRELKALVYQN